MFRPTLFVILFAVVLYANALPAPQHAPTLLAKNLRPLRAVEPAGTLDLSKKEPGKADLDTDATTYLGYDYGLFRGSLYPSDIYGLGTYGWPSTYRSLYYPL